MTISKKKICSFNLGISQGCVQSWPMNEGTVILDCNYTKNNGVTIYALVRDIDAPRVNRSFVFYGAWSEPQQLDNRNRYWHVGTAHQRFDQQHNMNGSTYIPDDIVYFIFEVE